MDADQERRNHDEAKAGLRNEVVEVAGEQAAARAERKGALDAAVSGEGSKQTTGALSQYRSLLVIGFFLALIVGAVIALITGSWWWLLVALAIHAIGTVVVVGTAMSQVTQAESPDPRTAAALQARGVTNPDAALNQAVDAAADESEEAAEARRQRTEVTPSPRSEPTGGGPARHPEGGRA